MEEIEEMIDEADQDGSGSINFPEFVGLMLAKQNGGTTREEIKQVKTDQSRNWLLEPICNITLQLFFRLFVFLTKMAAVTSQVLS